MGGTFNPAAGNAKVEGVITRVPAGMSAYCAVTACQGRSTSGIGAFKGQHRDGTVVNDFRLASSTGTTLFELVELQLKPLRPRLSAASSMAATDGMQYTVEWGASSLVSRLAEGTSSPSPGSWSLTPQGEAAQWQRSNGRNASEVASMQLQALQTYVADPKARSFSLQTAGWPTAVPVSCSSACRTGGASAAAGWAMLRVAAQEQKRVQWQSCALDSQARGSQAALHGTDTFGSISSAGVWLAPQLIASRDRAQSTAAPSPAAALKLRGTVLVTGGLGDIGLLVGLWLVACWPDARVLLLSRTGRSSTLPKAASNAATPLTAVRCDVSCADELRALVTELAANGAPPVEAIFHAGGILQVRVHIA